MILKDILFFGLGYTAKFLAKGLMDKGWEVSGTARTPEGVEDLKKLGVNALQFTGLGQSDEIRKALKTASHILVSAGPGANGDPVLAHHLQDLNPARLRWVGYLSTVGVYGDWAGEWVDETNITKPRSERSRYRVAAENKWLDLFRKQNLPVHIFRLAGIYGPGRNAFKKLKSGTARRIVKAGQVFNRIHVLDIANVLEASIRKPDPGAVYNVADDKPCPPQEVVSYAANLLNMEPPPLVSFENADMTPMARSFYGENKRVRNTRIKQDLGVTLKFPTYKEGLDEILKTF